MTNNAYPTTTPGATTSGSAAPIFEATASKSKGKNQSKKTTEKAVDSAREVAGSATHEAGTVVHEAATQVKKLASQTRDELTEQASTQQRRVADGFRAAGSELSAMSAAPEASGIASGIVSTVGQRADDVAEWLEQREPADLMHEVSAFARARPVVFIGLAAVVGVLAGRLTRSLATSDDETSTAPRTSYPSTSPSTSW